MSGECLSLILFLFRNVWTVWISSLPILYFVMHHTTALSPDPFLVLLFVSYTLLSYISFNIDRVKGFTRPEEDTVPKLYLRMLFYTFYNPYLVSLIVLYRDFERQITERPSRPRDIKDIVIFTLRIAFWWIVLELALHFFYFGAILSDVNFASKLPKNEFVVMGMAIGKKK